LEGVRSVQSLNTDNLPNKGEQIQRNSKNIAENLFKIARQREERLKIAKELYE
jgi:hypothetical protein